MKLEGIIYELDPKHTYENEVHLETENMIISVLKYFIYNKLFINSP